VLSWRLGQGEARRRRARYKTVSEQEQELPVISPLHFLRRSVSGTIEVQGATVGSMGSAGAGLLAWDYRCIIALTKDFRLQI
jgi:hypothetical protein